MNDEMVYININEVVALIGKPKVNVLVLNRIEEQIKLHMEYAHPHSRYQLIDGSVEELGKFTYMIYCYNFEDRSLAQAVHCDIRNYLVFLIEKFA